MEYKISELVSKSGVPKSTILYYIKEGMLPEAKKLKSNVHRYSDKHLELLQYINYMKEHFGSTNEQLKDMLQYKDLSFSTSSSMIVPLMNALSAIPSDTKHYTKSEFMERFSVEETLLEQLIADEIIIPTDPNDFTDKEASIMKLISYFQEAGIEYEILKMYVFHAKALSLLEHQMQARLCDIRNDKNFSTLWKIVFETLFNAKTYIFNRQTYKAYFSTLKNEVLK
ncbi:MerR family transcriptional regulator [Sulfurovum sp. zt1-1]|uniref:MerR family transcriptional regulator n=1 Tax=Sulfurovum zhangzhouensis TaxID=3019067 RepID=A0ABT7QXV4_9BACT|nr:MerR family transcriptional regulator [Sulfurovum zhangzhouensis]MDM5271661.1 MerR family transcriptional regulator [Sulfurovum zhangzhouensis]